MKKLLTAIMLVALFAVGAGTAEAQGEAEAPATYAFGGGEYDSGTKGFTTTVGISTRLIGNLRLMPRIQVGEYGSLETDVGYFFNPTDAFSIALLAGPAVDWVAQEEAGPMAYLIGASGFVAGYMPKDIGVWVGAKYKFKFDKEAQAFYEDGWQGGLWLSFALGG